MMRPDRIILTMIAGCVVLATPGYGQTSSLGAKNRSKLAKDPPVVAPREAPRVERNAVYQKYAWIATKPRKAKKFKPGDLITIIVRERRRFEADADLETKNRFDITSELDAFLKATAGGIGAAEFRRGHPNIEYKFGTKLKKEADTNREDRMTMRLTGEIIDVKPNGLLVLQAKARIQHDDEISEISLTGTCRKEDVTADNTILSTQLGDKQVKVHNEGALRAAATRGWIPKLLDWLKPF